MTWSATNTVQLSFPDAPAELAPGLRGLDKALAIRQFVLAGRAILTLQSPQTDKHYTFRVKPATDGRWYVDLLTGPQNVGDGTGPHNEIFADDHDLPF